MKSLVFRSAGTAALVVAALATGPGTVAVAASPATASVATTTPTCPVSVTLPAKVVIKSYLNQPPLTAKLNGCASAVQMNDSIALYFGGINSSSNGVVFSWSSLAAASTARTSSIPFRSRTTGVTLAAGTYHTAQGSGSQKANTCGSYTSGCGITPTLTQTSIVAKYATHTSLAVARSGSRVTLTAHTSHYVLSPDNAFHLHTAPVALQVYSSAYHAWRTLKTLSTDLHGAATYVATVAGTHPFRAVQLEQAKYWSSTSAVVTK